MSINIPSKQLLRPRKRTYQFQCDRRESSAHKFYRDLCSDKDKPHKTVSVKAFSLKKPSKSRIDTQRKIEEQNEQRQNGTLRTPKPRHSYSLIKPNDPISESEQPEDSDADTVIYTPPPNPPCKKETTIECKVKTTTYGIKKQRSHRIRNYYCEKCDSVFTKSSALNDHYKKSHAPVTCKICNKHFSVPSTLNQTQVTLIRNVNIPAKCVLKNSHLRATYLLTC